MNLSPRSISLHEANPSSVSSYDVQILAEDGTTVLATDNFASDPSGDTTINLGLADGLLQTIALGTTIIIKVRQVGPSGALTAYQQVNDVNSNSYFSVRELPDGVETAVVNV